MNPRAALLIRPIGYMLAGGLLGLTAAVVIHEGAHIMLFERYGCGWSLSTPLRSGLWIAVTPDCPGGTSERLAVATAAAEAVGYHLYLASGIIGVGLGARQAMTPAPGGVAHAG